jgi:hypothetical protein
MGPPRYSTNMPLIIFWLEHFYIQVKKKLLIYNFEDQPLSEIAASEEEFLKPYSKRINLLVLRDPYNLFASRLKAFRNWLPDPAGKVYVEMWKEHAKEFLKKTNYLENKVCINFNKWCESNNYRTQLCRQLKIIPTDQGFSEKATQGWGSSFDENENKITSYRDRFKLLLNDKQYIKLFKEDRELIDLSNCIFGKIPGVDDVFKN